MFIITCHVYQLGFMQTTIYHRFAIYFKSTYEIKSSENKFEADFAFDSFGGICKKVKQLCNAALLYKADYDYKE